jgi:hypothetical protein
MNFDITSSTEHLLGRSGLIGATGIEVLGKTEEADRSASWVADRFWLLTLEVGPPMTLAACAANQHPSDRW